MKEKLRNKRCGTWATYLFVLVVSALFTTNVNAFTVNVVDSDGAAISGGFRWLLEEDNTNVTDPGQRERVTISTDIHNSHAPVVAEGLAAGNSTAIIEDASSNPLDPLKQYFISVLPDSGYSISGTVVEDAVAGVVTVIVNDLPLPTAQISLLAFVDQNPINNVVDEHDQRLGGATVVVFDTAGQLSQDAFANPLGTQYAFDPGTGLAILVGGVPTVTQIGSGILTTLTQEDFDAGGTANPYNLKVGEALIKYLVPGKYGVQVVPPLKDDDGVTMTWSQTSTIEGTKTVDAWVKANEPKLFVEGFGIGFNHVFYGFVKVSPTSPSTYRGQTYSGLEWNQSPPAATGSISGTLRMNHFSKPPNLQGFYPGVRVANCWVALNDPLVLPGLLLGEAGKYAAPCNEDSSFTINNVPPGTYQLVTWDTYLDSLFGIHTVTVPPGSGGTGEAVNLGNILTFRWFGTLENYVFYDEDQDGFRDPGEPGIPEQNVNIRFRDGTIYQAFPTDLDGYVPFDEVFPFFKWLVVEVDYGRFKATGMTTAVDDGGPIPGPNWPADGNKNPQPQDINDPFNEYGDIDSRTETGPVLTQAMHLFLGQANLIEWGKKDYAFGENGGISGMVLYAVTRAEDDPQYAAAEEWEPGVPRVQVNLYQDMVINVSGLPGSDGIIDDIDTNAGVTLADVDNYPFQWAPAYSAEPGYTGVRGLEDVDWNLDGLFDAGDSIQVVTTDSWDDNKPSGCIQDLPLIEGAEINECADSFGTWNQVRPGLFDGGYAFTDIPSGSYIVEAATPPGYILLKEEDKNVDFGDTFTPSPLLLPPACVGDDHTVPFFLSFDGATDAPYANETRPLCDRKQVALSTGQNAAADFFVFTQVPKAARAVGFVNNDLGAEFNQASPIYGEKLAAPWLPVSFRDWKGNELVRVYTDEFGGYNAMLPSTYTVNVPSPTGVSPNMITLVLNDPFFADGVTPDPFHDQDYAVTPWTFHYFPGATSYLDTPIVPVAAFTANEVRIDTGPANGTPVIYSVANTSAVGPQAGPLVCTDIAGSLPATVTLNAPPGGFVSVRNPLYPSQSNIPTITRDAGFGTTQGTGNVTLDDGVVLMVLPVVSWANGVIVVTLPGGSTTGRIMVNRSNGMTSEVGVTMNVTDCSALTVRTVSSPALIQDQINAATAGDIILVAPGFYNENVIMHKPVRLQGSGAGSVINANPVPTDRLQAWHDFVDGLGAQEFITFLLKNPFSAGEAPGVFVVGETVHPDGNIENPGAGTLTLNPGNPFTIVGQAAVDGFTISGSKAGGGIFAVAGATGLEISNNTITNNQGNISGGIALGTPDSGFDANNNNVVIRQNKIHKNGGVQGAGGIALNEGSADYLVEDNLIIGNFGRFNGGGIQHRGVSAGDNIIRGNRILFNEIFFGVILAVAGDGAGIYIGGDVVGGTGAGSVTINDNLIQGNMTGSGNGGGIRAFAVNAEDVRIGLAGDDSSWNRLNIFNNIIVNNVAGNSGAGISLQDVARANIINNTIANNDSTATSSQSFEAGQPNSTPQPSGLVSAIHSGILQGLLSDDGFVETYSNPVLANNIVYQNRSFFNDAALSGGAGGLAVNPAGPYWDIHVMGSLTGADPHLSPQFSLFTSSTNPATGFSYAGNNTVGSPGFLGSYFNTIESTTVIDEGSNAINLRFTPLPPVISDYHIGVGQAWETGSLAALSGFTELVTDFDGEPRPYAPSNIPDIGADEIQAPGPLSGSFPAPPVNGELFPLLVPHVGPGTGDTSISLGSIGKTLGDSVSKTLTSSSSVVIDGNRGSFVVRVKDNLVGFLDNLIPGREDNSLSGGDGITRNTPVSDFVNVSGFSNRQDVPSGEDQVLDEVGNLTGNSQLSQPVQEDIDKAVSGLVQEQASLSGSGTGSVYSTAKKVQSVAELAGAGLQGETKSTLLRYILVGLILACLALLFFAVVVPKIINEREQ